MDNLRPSFRRCPSLVAASSLLVLQARNQTGRDQLMSMRIRCTPPFLKSDNNRLRSASQFEPTLGPGSRFTVPRAPRIAWCNALDQFAAWTIGVNANNHGPPQQSYWSHWPLVHLTSIDLPAFCENEHCLGDFGSCST